MLTTKHSNLQNTKLSTSRDYIFGSSHEKYKVQTDSNNSPRRVKEAHLKDICKNSDVLYNINNKK